MNVKLSNLQLNKFKSAIKNETEVVLRLLLKGVSEAIQNEVNEEKKGFHSTLLGTLGASFLGNLLTGKGSIRAGYGSEGF